MTGDAQLSIVWEGSMAALAQQESLDSDAPATETGFGCVDWYQYTPLTAVPVSQEVVGSAESVRPSVAAYSFE